MRKLTRHITNESSHEEKCEIEKWAQKSTDNQKDLEAYQKIWEISKTTSNLYEPNVFKAWNRIDKKCQVKRKISLYQYAAIASVFLIIGLFTNWMLQPSPTVWKQMVGTEQSSKTPFVLVDGTKIWLNEGAILKYPQEYADDLRQVKLQGEAYFEVSKNKSKPFEVVLTEDVKVKVLGTAFNIKMTSNKIDVDVTEGKVAFGTEEKLYLTRGMRGTYDTEQKALNEEVLSSNAFAWKTGVLTFEKENLSTVLKTLEDHYQTSLRLTDEEYATKEISASFDNQSLEEVIEILELIVGKKQSIETYIK
ncbi:MAG: DUF4974 domain-containing protein [Cytophagales bacterium]|nr:DUF4974 domain-containing protein [Cytophagales bacterium]